MGGRIWVESQLGKGSCFHFVVPVGAGQAQDCEPPAVPVCLAGVAALVVDDNATNRRILLEMLRRWSMQPVMAASAAEAVAILRRPEPRFPLLLVDASMPEMDGFTLVEQIRGQFLVDDMAIVMLTSAGQYGDAVRCRELGIAARLIKPVFQPQLLDAILDVLGTRPARIEQPRLAASGGFREGLRSLRILLAEDNPVNQKLASRLIEKRGHGVVVAGNGREALEALKREKFDVVVMDVQMPEVDGLEATAAIRAGESGTGNHIPIIALTAHAMTGDRERCLTAGMDAYLSKPIRAAELFEVIESILR